MRKRRKQTKPPAIQKHADTRAQNEQSLALLLQAHREEQKNAQSYAWLISVAFVTALYFLYLYVTSPTTTPDSDPGMPEYNDPADKLDHSIYATEAAALTLLLPVANHLTSRLISASWLLTKRYAALNNIHHEDLNQLVRLHKRSQPEKFHQLGAPKILEIKQSRFRYTPLIGLLPVSFWLVLLTSYYRQTTTFEYRARVLNDFAVNCNGGEPLELPDYALDLSNFTAGLLDLEEFQVAIIAALHAALQQCDQWLTPEALYPASALITEDRMGQYFALKAKAFGMAPNELMASYRSQSEPRPVSGVRFTASDAYIFNILDLKFSQGSIAFNNGIIGADTLQREHNSIAAMYGDQLQSLLSAQQRETFHQTDCCYKGLSKAHYEPGYIDSSLKYGYATYHNVFRTVAVQLLQSMFPQRFAGSIIITLECMLFFRPIITGLMNHISSAYDKKTNEALLRTHSRILNDNGDGSYRLKLKSASAASLRNWLALFVKNPQVEEIDGTIYAVPGFVNPTSYQRFLKAKSTTSLPSILEESQCNELKKLYEDLITAAYKLSSNNATPPPFIDSEQVFEGCGTSLHISFDAMGGINFRAADAKQFIQRVRDSLKGYTVKLQADVISAKIEFTPTTQEQVVSNFVRTLRKIITQYNTELRQRGRRVTVGRITQSSVKRQSGGRKGRTGRKQHIADPSETQANAADAAHETRSKYITLQPNSQIDYVNAQKQTEHFTNSSAQPVTVFVTHSRHNFDRLYVIPEDEVIGAFGFMFPNIRRPETEQVAEMVADKLDSWCDPQQAGHATRFNFTQWRSDTELPQLPNRNCRAVKFRARNSADRTHFEEVQANTGVYHYTGVANHGGRYIYQPKRGEQRQEATAAALR